MKDQDMYDEFYDYYGQDYYDAIKLGTKITEKEWMSIWGIHSAEEFLKTWRGNSNEEYKKWKKEHGYE